MMALPALLLAVVILAYVIGKGGPASEDEIRGALPFLLAVNHVTVFGLLVLALRWEERTLTDVGWCLPPDGSLRKHLLIGVLAALALYVWKELVWDSIRLLAGGNPPSFTSLFRFRFPASDVPMLVAATVLPAVEESVYRGYGLAALDARWGRAAALIAMAVLFGLLHWGNGPLSIVFTGIMGVAFAGLYLWRRTLIAPVIAHSLYNAMVLFT